MDKSNRFQNLRFERQAWYSSPRLGAVVIALVIFTLGWFLIPVNLLFFLIVLPVLGIVWAASYGWRQALSILLDWLHRLERL